MKRLTLLLAVLALTLPVPASAFHHAFVPGGPCGTSTNSGGGNATATAAIRAHNPAQGGTALPLPPTGTPAAANPNTPITNPPTPATCPAPQK